MVKAYGVPGNSPIYDWPTSMEYLEKLKSGKAILIFDQMRRSDPQVKAILKAITLSLTKANYFVEPASEASIDVAAAEFVEKNLFEDMSITWRDTLRQILLHLPYGYMPFEKIYEYHKAENKVLLRKLDPRLPISIERFNFDSVKHRLISLTQRDTDGKEYTIPIEKLVMFVHEKEGDNWEGTSLLRPAYGSWWLKNTLLKIDAMKHDRYGVGIPVAKMPPGFDSNSPEWRSTEDALEAIQAQEKSFIVLPDGTGIDVLNSAGGKAGTDVIASIRYHNEQIAASVLAQFLMLGTTETGSRALGDSLGDFFLTSIQELAEYIVEILNRFVIKELVDLNFVVGAYPLLKVSRIAGLDMAVIGALKSAGLLTANLELENNIRKQLGLPEISEEDYENVKEQNSFIQKQTTQQNIKDEDQEDAKEKREDIKQSEITLREPNEIENLFDFAEAARVFEFKSNDAKEQLLRLRDAQKQYIIMQIVSGKRVNDIVVNNKKEMYELLSKTYKASMLDGINEIKREIVRQRPNLKMAEKPTEAKIDEIVDEEIRLQVDGASNKLKSIIAEFSLALKKVGVLGDELRRELEKKADEDISDSTWVDLASGAVNQGWGQGRERGAEQFINEIDYGYRSAIMEKNSCAVCRAKDGHNHVWGDPEYMAPDPACLGTVRRCRCVSIAVMKSEAATNGSV